MKTILKRKYVKLTIVIVLLLFILSGCAQSSYVKTNQLRFRTISRIPVVQGTINGKSAFFIIDTGASVSILNESESKYFGFKSFSRADQNISGFSGRAKINQAYNCVVEVGPIKVNHVTFHTKCLKEVVNIIWESEHIEIAGIIGSDVFNMYKITINYKDNTITF